MIAMTNTITSITIEIAMTMTTALRDINMTNTPLLTENTIATINMQAKESQAWINSVGSMTKCHAPCTPSWISQQGTRGTSVCRTWQSGRSQPCKAWWMPTTQGSTIATSAMTTQAEQALPSWPLPATTKATVEPTMLTIILPPFWCRLPHPRRRWQRPLKLPSTWQSTPQRKRGPLRPLTPVTTRAITFTPTPYWPQRLPRTVSLWTSHPNPIKGTHQ